MSLLSGCDLLPSRSSGPLELDFAEILPTGWEAVGRWREVNIDNDQAIEYLLFFQYDSGPDANGPVGAVIYDSQIASEVVGVVDISATPAPSATVELVPVPLQSFGYYRPYRLLPSYWAYTYGSRASHNMGQGYVAPPGAAEAVGVYSMARPDAGASAPADRELVLRGGNTHLTFVWWKGELEGYGVTQLYAGGGFDGVDWEAWSENPTPLVAVSGLEPLRDYRARSQICREIAYQRRGVEGGQAPPPAEGDDEPALDLGGDAITATDRMTTGRTTPADSAIVFAASDRGLRFCTGSPPPHPFYPEGVVLAYLRQVRSDNAPAASLVSPDSSTDQVEAQADLSSLEQERIEDIATHSSIPVRPADLAAGEFAPTTAVCVELARLDDPDLRRWVVFTLRYQPPDLVEKLPDRWTISGAQLEPEPVSPPAASYCTTVLSRAMP